MLEEKLCGLYWSEVQVAPGRKRCKSVLTSYSCNQRPYPLLPHSRVGLSLPLLWTHPVKQQLRRGDSSENLRQKKKQGNLSAALFTDLDCSLRATPFSLPQAAAASPTSAPEALVAAEDCRTCLP
jgi:hypothetical protein